MPWLKMRKSLIMLVAAAGIACGQAPTAPAPGPPSTVDLTASLSAKFDSLPFPVGAGGAACSISITRGGQVLFEGGRGQVAPGRPASVDSLYRIASLTKPFTASAVLISEQAGRLNRNDKLSQYRAYAEPAPTIDELIKHIPGLSNYTDTPEYQSERSSPTTLEGLVSLIQPWDGLRRYQYSNSHYVYLGGVLQQVNGLPYEQIVQRDIFGPTGMSRSSFAMPPVSESVGYPFPSNTDPSWVLYGGGITSTAADMSRFNQALLNNQFGFGALESFDRSAGVTSFGMGGAMPNGDLRFAHTGNLDSYASYTTIFPADRSSVVILCNFPINGLPEFVLGVGGIRSIVLGG